MSLPEHTLIGCDFAGDDDTVVVMTRQADGTWRLDSTDGPDALDIAALVEQALAVQPTHRGLAQQANEWLAEHRGDFQPAVWRQQVEQWLAEHVGADFQLTAWQRTLLEQAHLLPGKG